ncbi:alanine racemase [Candidatus Methylomirabilis lanthanidiphila]|uniref:Alanine racemase n=1 Tax=Candidatus Methylomirabilis lanthanidiphila TaxID=2211376 RepID=A0A564ZIV0_9BACT|nr:alanine racemase [Candidatus Methylomirabilis lanthanidiphila]VUZ85224.1 alanine racemase [Candidatus Methylomirabilis lanthanidiphila]
MSSDQGLGWAADRMPPTHRAWVEVDLGAIRHNIVAIRRLLKPSTQFMSVVKADGYGHGAVAVARTALSAGASWLAVATIEEGIQLRRAGIDAPILLFGPAICTEEVETLVEYRLQPTVCSLDQARRLSAADLGSIQIHLKVDTGMTRLGVAWQEAQELLSAIRVLPNVTVAGLYSHLATADAIDPTTTLEQFERFAKLVNTLRRQGIRPPLVHLANSAATLTFPDTYFDLVRIGLAQYGLYPSSHLQTVVALRPALSLKARIVFVKTVPPGTGVSYGHTFRTGHRTRLATVSIGYGDGVSRALSNGIDFLVRGRRVRQVGTITMDQCLIDVTDVREACEGDIVTLLGRDGEEQISIAEWVERLKTIPYEILTTLSPRLPRIVCGEAVV